jgi:NADH:ubiquinone oxidoreductase subunit 2 (subunit N)
MFYSKFKFYSKYFYNLSFATLNLFFLVFFFLILINLNTLQIDVKVEKVNLYFVFDSVTVLFVSIFILFLIIFLKNYIYLFTIYSFEFFLFFFFSVFGLLQFLISSDFLNFYLSLEIFGLSSYILVGLRSSRKFTSESAFKFFLISAVSSLLIAFGIAQIYAFSGLLNFEDLKLFL